MTCKSIILALIIMSACYALAVSQTASNHEVILTNGSTLKVQRVEEVGDSVYLHLGGGLQPYVVSRSNLLLITYPDGREALYHDRVTRLDGSVLYGTILRVSDTHVEVDPVGDIPFLLVRRSESQSIKYRDGTVVQLKEIPAVPVADGQPHRAAQVAEKDATTPAVVPNVVKIVEDTAVAAPAATVEESTVPAAATPEIITNSIGMKLKLIQPGEFEIGSKIKDDNAQPMHKVIISKPYYVGIFEVTQSEYETVTGKNRSKFKGASLPVEKVNWEDAVAFCRKLSEMERATYRLPTEAEWEYACRAGSVTRFYWGDALGSETMQYCWYYNNSGKRSHTIGMRDSNPWGLHDMNGNVWEWCSDWYANSYVGVDETDPQGQENGKRKVCRGGGWESNNESLASAHRIGNKVKARAKNVGFRVVMEVKNQ